VAQNFRESRCSVQLQAVALQAVLQARKDTCCSGSKSAGPEWDPRCPRHTIFYNKCTFSTYRVFGEAGSVEECRGISR